MIEAWFVATMRLAKIVLRLRIAVRCGLPVNVAVFVRVQNLSFCHRTSHHLHSLSIAVVLKMVIALLILVIFELLFYTFKVLSFLWLLWDLWSKKIINF
jgi:hypothetical protein